MSREGSQGDAAVDPLCLNKAALKFTNAFARAESPGLCDAGNTGNAATVAARVDQYVNDVVAAVPPP